jgi:hypothetical protein
VRRRCGRGTPAGRSTTRGDGACALQPEVDDSALGDAQARLFRGHRIKSGEAHLFTSRSKRPQGGSF